MNHLDEDFVRLRDSVLHFAGKQAFGIGHLFDLGRGAMGGGGGTTV